MFSTWRANSSRKHRHAGLQLNDSIGDELADYIIESGKPFFTLMR